MHRHVVLLALTSLLAAGCAAGDTGADPSRDAATAPTTATDAAGTDDGADGAASPDTLASDEGTPADDSTPSDADTPSIRVTGPSPAPDAALDCETGRLLAVGTADHDSDTVFAWSNQHLGPDSPGGYQDGVLGMAHWAGGDSVQQLVGVFESTTLVTTDDAIAALQTAAADEVAVLDIGIVSPWSERNSLDVPQYATVIDIVATSDLFREVIVFPCPAA